MAGKNDELNNRRNLAEEIAYNQMMIELGEVRRWVENHKLKESLIPADWHKVEKDVPVRRRKTKVTADFEYGASRALLYDWTTASVQYRARHRMGRNAPVQIAAPFWALDAIKLDLAIQLHNSNDFWTISDQQAMAALTARKIDPVWYVDNPSGTFPNQAMATPQNQGNLNLWPTAVKAFVYAPGTFVKLDGGTLDVGLVRDSVLNRTNDLQLFMEEWLGMAMLGYQSIALTSFICINGTGPNGVTPRACP